MKIEIDLEADALYIEFQEGKWHKNKKIDDFTVIDLDRKGNLLGIELLQISKRIPKESLAKVDIINPSLLKAA